MKVERSANSRLLRPLHLPCSCSFSRGLRVSLHGKPGSRSARDLKVLVSLVFRLATQEHRPTSLTLAATGRREVAGQLKDPAPALLMILYALAVAGGSRSSTTVMLGKDTLRKWVIICSPAAFCLLTLQILLGFPAESWLKGLPGQLAELKNSMDSRPANGAGNVCGCS